MSQQTEAIGVPQCRRTHCFFLSVGRTLSPAEQLVFFRKGRHDRPAQARLSSARAGRRTDLMRRKILARGPPDRMLHTDR